MPLTDAIGKMGLSPRVRGNPMTTTAANPKSGSIPACAGEPSAAAASAAARRSGSIPACAGEPTTNSAMPPPPAVYPRVCGGTASCPARAAAVSGLSPRVRGNHYAGVYYAAQRRSIPACAGEPDPGTGLAAARTVYPRVCGGTLSNWPTTPSARGLSPRVRGNRVGNPEQPDELGSIPACAGEPPAAARRQPCRPVYPRVCGGTTDGVSTDALR